jgi:hypothetical protein
MINFLRILSVAGGLLLTGAIFWAFGLQSFWEGVDVVTSSPWGQVTLIDLYLGFALVAALIFVFEKSLITALFWIVPIFFLGNVWAALWMIIRAKLIVTRLRGNG